MPNSAQQEQLSTTYRPIRSVPVSGIRQLYEVFAACHDEPSLDVFIHDLGRKSGVILVTRQRDGRIVGFATQTIAPLDVNGERVIGVLSDDAVVLPAYWPRCDLAGATRALLLKVKLRHLSTPVYWCQLARHYRSYLLMAEQARRMHPGVGGIDHRLKRVAQVMGRRLFGDAFDTRRMLLAATGDNIVRPRLPAVEATPALAEADARIALFRKLNPAWRRGTALLSVSEFDAQSVVQSLQSLPARWIRRHILRNYGRHREAGTSPARANPTPQQQASWQDSSLDEALERGETP